jgi:hypothetical protein
MRNNFSTGLAVLKHLLSRHHGGRQYGAGKNRLTLTQRRGTPGMCRQNSYRTGPAPLGIALLSNAWAAVPVPGRRLRRVLCPQGKTTAAFKLPTGSAHSLPATMKDVGVLICGMARCGVKAR